MDRDPLLEQLAALPPIAPSAELDVQVRHAAHAIMTGSNPSLFEKILYRGVLPTLLSGVTATYLIWAVQAASALY